MITTIFMNFSFSLYFTFSSSECSRSVFQSSSSATHSYAMFSITCLQTNVICCVIIMFLPTFLVTHSVYMSICCAVIRDLNILGGGGGSVCLCMTGKTIRIELFAVETLLISLYFFHFRSHKTCSIRHSIKRRTWQQKHISSDFMILLGAIYVSHTWPQSHSHFLSSSQLHCRFWQQKKKKSVRLMAFFHEQHSSGTQTDI